MLGRKGLWRRASRDIMAVLRELKDAAEAKEDGGATVAACKVR